MASVSLVRSWWLYVVLLVLAFGLHVPVWMFRSAADGVAPSTAATQAEHALTPSLTSEELLAVFKAHPELVERWAAWITLLCLMIIGGVTMSVAWMLARRRGGARLPAGASLRYCWPASDVVRLILMGMSMALLLPLALPVLSGSAGDARAWSVVGMLILETVLLLMIGALAQSRGVAPFVAVGLGHGPRARSVLQSLLAYVRVFPWLLGLLAGVVFVFRRLGIELPVEPIQELLLTDRRDWVFALTLVLACVWGPIVEELVFRGIVFSALRRVARGSLAALASGALFAAAHTNPIGFLSIWGLGTLLALQYERTGSLVGPIVVHIVHNTLLIGVTLSLYDVAKLAKHILP